MEEPGNTTTLVSFVEDNVLIDTENIKTTQAPRNEEDFFLVSQSQDEPYFGQNVVEAEQQTEETLAWTHLCRICATPKNQMIPIFEDVGLEYDLFSKILKYLPIHVSKNDTLPLQVCYQCASILLSWHELIEGCLNAEKKLLEIQDMLQNKHEYHKSTPAENEVEISASIAATTATLIPGIDSLQPDQQDKNDNKHEIHTDAEEDTNNKSRLQIVSRDRAGSCSQKAWRIFAEKRISKSNPIQAKTPDTVDENSRGVLTENIATNVSNEHSFRTSTLCKTRASDKSTSNETKRKKSSNCVIRTKAGRNASESGACIDHDADRPKSGKVVSADSVLVCKICNKTFCSGKSHRIHIRVHSGEKSYTCHICGKQFVQGGSLYYHLKHVHDGVKNHTCDICGRSFAMKTAMEDHRRIHTGERPYVCHTCGKTFKTKASIYIHNKTHTDEFPHNCAYCTKRFRWRQQMLVHLTVHTGEKNHTCDVCGKGFGVKNDLTRHKRIHSNEKPYMCQRCGISFSQKRYLKSHERLRLGICEYTKSSNRVESR